MVKLFFFGKESRGEVFMNIYEIRDLERKRKKEMKSREMVK